LLPNHPNYNCEESALLTCKLVQPDPSNPIHAICPSNGLFDIDNSRTASAASEHTTCSSDR
jgi:hypothetical protein